MIDMIFRLVNDLEDHGEFTRPTLAAFEAASDFNTVILYALVHEPLYCQGYDHPNFCVYSRH